MKVSCKFCDLCLPDYFGGHHLAWVCVPAYKMSFKALREQLHDEVNQGAFGGSNDLIMDYSGIEGDKFYKACHAAINRDIKPAIKGKRLVFEELSFDNDYSYNGDTPQAYFVFEIID